MGLKCTKIIRMLNSLLKNLDCKPKPASGWGKKYLKIYKKFQRLGLAAMKGDDLVQGLSLCKNMFVITTGRKLNINMSESITVGQHFFNKNLIRLIFGTEKVKRELMSGPIGSSIILNQLNQSGKNNIKLTKAELTNWAARIIQDTDLWNEQEFEKVEKVSGNERGGNNIVLGCIVKGCLFIEATELKQSNLVKANAGLIMIRVGLKNANLGLINYRKYLIGLFWSLTTKITYGKEISV